MRRLILILIASGLAIASAVPASATDQADFSGEWRQVSLFGIYTLAKPNAVPCSYFSRTERTLQLVPVPAHPLEMRGLGRRDTVLMWTGSYTMACRWADETQFVPSAESNATFVLDAKLDPATATLTVTGHFDNCDGLICFGSVPDSVRSDKTPNSFKLLLSDGELLDQDLTGGERRIFLRTTVVAEKLAAAQDVLAGMEQLLNAGKADELMGQYSSKGFSSSGTFVKPMLLGVDRESKRVRVVQLYGTWYGLYPQERGEYLYVVNRVTDHRGRFHFEYEIWKREETSWRLDYLVET